MRAVVTGGAGFIGSHLVRRLRSDGASVTIIDDLSTGKEQNVPDDPEVSLRRLDLTRDAIEDPLRDADVIFHLAAIPSVPRSVAEPLGSHAASATATLRLLLAARTAGVPRVISSSSSSVYGDQPSSPKREDMATFPLSPYAVGKLAAEGYVRVFARLYGMETISLRYFNVFGPRQDPASTYAAAIPRFIRAYLRREPPTVYGDGEQTRDFTYVDNVVDGNMLAARAAALDGGPVNVAAGDPKSVNDVLRALAGIFGHEMKPSFAPTRPGDIRDSHADIARARKLLGFEPAIPFDEGLRRTVEWIRSASL